MDAPASFILASASPRRRDLLSRIHYTPKDIIAANIDETQLPQETVASYVKRIAETKATTIAIRHPGEYILAGDTAVTQGNQILPKAEDEETAKSCLQKLSGKRHRVYTSICLVSPEGKKSTRVVKNSVQFKRLSAEEMTYYLASNDWEGKAGGYAIQGIAESFISWMDGSHSAIIGLPLYETRQLLIGHNIHPNA